MESDSSDFLTFRRRYLLRTLGAVGAGALAGCAGDDGSSEPDSSEDDEATENNSTPEETATPEPDYGLPESEHANPVDMATEWMLPPDNQGDDLQVVAFSPSKLSEYYEKSLTREINAEEKYGPFEFHHTDIPETYIQHSIDPSPSRFKVDQLPNNVSEDDVVQQLEDAGYTNRLQRGDFEVYAGEDGFHAVGNDRHVVVVGGDTASNSQERSLMLRVLEETNENSYEIPEVMQRGFDELDVQDSLTVVKRPGYAVMPSTGTSYNQPDIGMSSVNFAEGEKNGAWPFEDPDAAENVVAVLEDQDVRDGYSNIRLDNKTVTAEDGEYEIGELGTYSWLRVSDCRI